jgi:hypothetical protein
VTLQSREFIEKLLREYADNTGRAQSAKAAGTKAFEDAAGFEQQAANLSTREQAALAKIQQAQAELQQVQTERQEASGYAEKAREYGTSQMASHDSFAGQAADARTVLESFNIAIPDQSGNAEFAAVPSAVKSIDPAGPTRVDLSDDPRMNGPMDRFNDAHNEEDQQDPQAGAA